MNFGIVLIITGVWCECHADIIT